MGIPKELRVTKSKDFSSIRQQGLRRVYPYFIAQLKLDDGLYSGRADESAQPAEPAQPTEPTEPKKAMTSQGTQGIDSPVLTRLGVIASRRVGNAVVRNRGKRLVRRLFYKHKHYLPAGSQLVIVLRLGIDKASFAQLEADFLAACLWYQQRFMSKV